ncbi:hypothetical protein TNCV_762981 [Trichonephila clavipes]|nr:hypothetical protein TNCV_762981 [Trichonephila clavipes]
MIDKAWRAVTPLAIHNCFKKSGFPSPNLVDMDNTLTEFKAEPSLWEALPEQDLTFDDYMLVDTDIAVWGALSDAEIVALDHNNTESDEDDLEKLTLGTLSEAKVSQNKLRNFFLQNHLNADILQASFVLEKSIDKFFTVFCSRKSTKSKEAGYKNGELSTPDPPFEKFLCAPLLRGNSRNQRITRRSQNGQRLHH